MNSETCASGENETRAAFGTFDSGDTASFSWRCLSVGRLPREYPLRLLFTEFFCLVGIGISGLAVLPVEVFYAGQIHRLARGEASI
jgi:hypothetical protein